MIIGYKEGKIQQVENPNQKAVQTNDSKVLDRMKEIAEEKGCNLIETKKEEEINRRYTSNKIILLKKP